MPPTITQQFPPVPIDELADLIRSFPGQDITGKKAIIGRLVDVHPIFNVDWGPGWRYRRVRDMSQHDRPDHVDGLIWRKDAIASLGRANPSGYQVLYLADRVDTALQETFVTDGAVIISEFSIQDGRSASIAPVGEFMRVHRTGRGFLSGEHSKLISELLNACDHDEGRSLIITDAFLYECLTGHDDYELSSHVAMCLFNKCPKLSAVAYTSRRQAGALCFAVKVENFWEKWALVAVRHAHARHLACGVYKLTCIKPVVRVCRSGMLVWSEAEIKENLLLELFPPFTPS